jgi:hypothetical protein
MTKYTRLKLLRDGYTFTEWVVGGKWWRVMVFPFQSRGGFSIFF